MATVVEKSNLAEVRTRLMMTKKYLVQLYQALAKTLDIDVAEFELSCPAGEITVDALGKISLNIRNIEFEIKQIEDTLSLLEDMEKGLKGKSEIN
jgi:hypothetical protein